MGAPIVHFEIGAVDAPAMQKFYSELLGWSIDSNNPWNYGMVDTKGEGGIGGGIMAAPHGEGWLTFYAQVDDIPATLDRAVQLGGSIALPMQEIPGMGWSAFFKDPEGNLVGLFKPAT
jgi:hypothetical protein